MWNSPGLLFKRHTSSGGNFQSQGRHSISGVVITEDRVCPPSFLRYYLLPAPAEASPPPHENPIIIRGHTSFSSFSRDRTPENWTNPQMNIDFFFSRPFQISYYISLYIIASAGNLDGHLSFEVLAVCSIAIKAICLWRRLEWLRSNCYTALN